MAKTGLQYFQNDWSKTVNWTNTQGISKSQWYPVYQLDLQRYANGVPPMSQAERARAILSASNLDASTALPTDNPSPTDVFHNVLHDISNIATGLEPTKLVQNIYDEFKNTVQHPSWLLDPTKNTLMQWLPGWADYGEFKQGGLSNVLEHPIVSLLDVLPAASGATKLLAHTDAGAAVASTLGMTPEQMARMGPMRLAGKAIGKIPTRKTGFDLSPAELAKKVASGDTSFASRLTIGQRWQQFSQAAGLSSKQAELQAGLLTTEKASTLQSVQLLKPFLESAGKLSQAEQQSLYQLIVYSGRSYPDLLNDSRIPVNISQAIRNYRDVETWSKEIALSSGTHVMLKLPEGDHEEMYQNTPSNPVLRANQNYIDAQATMAEASKTTDALAAQLLQADAQARPIITDLQKTAQTLYDSARLTGSATELDPAKVGPLFGTETANAVQMRAFEEIFSTGGIIDRLNTSLQNSDFRTFKEIVRQLNSKFKLKNFAFVGPELSTLRSVSDRIGKYADFRYKTETEYTTKFYKTTYPTYKAVSQALADFKNAVIKHPPDRWRPAYLDAYINNLLKHDRGNEILDAMAKKLRQDSTPKSTVAEARANPRVLYELFDQMAEASQTDVMSGVMSQSEAQEIKASALEEVSRLRAMGHEPHYVPSVSSSQLTDMAHYDVKITPTRILTPDAAHARLMEFTDSVYDIVGSATHAVKQQLQRDGTIEYLDNYVQQHLYSISDLEAMYRRERGILGTAQIASRRADFNNFLQNELHLKKFDPEAMFNLTTARLSRGAYYIHQDLAKGLDQSLKEWNFFSDKSVLGRGTQIFRMAVLGYSPRFIAHIVFGGSFLVALRISPHAFRFIGDAYKMTKEGTHEALRSHSTQYGADPVELHIIQDFRAGGNRAVDGASKTFHWWGGVKMRNVLLREMMDKLNLDPDQLSSWLKVLPALTFKFTNFATNMQRSLVYLDGAAKAERQGYILDESGHKVTVTPDRAHEEGMRAAERVMGDLRQMTPLERNVFTKVMPFYGWTKHILRYISSYPSDHPYRAMFLSNLANMNSEEVPSGLPTRIQLLFFLGSPDSQGNVSAVDVRALDPLRDVANYATIGGFLSSLNPAFTAPVAMVDPQIVFGDNVLYPTLQYNQLYGTKVAAPAGTPLTALEQYIPQATAIDALLGISSQYRSLRKTNPASFAKTIYESLGLPFTPSQINLRQIAAHQEIDRYQQAKQDALNAWQSGDFSGLTGYPTVPDPLQADYNITPTALETIYKRALAATGQPPSQVVPSLPAPNI